MRSPRQLTLTGRRSGVATAAALGLIAGGILALLYAPAEGRRTRREIGARAREGYARAASGTRKAGETLHDYRARVGNLVSRSKASLQSGGESVRQHLHLRAG